MMYSWRLSLKQNRTSSYTFCQKTNWNFGVGENSGKVKYEGFINAGRVVVIHPAQKRNSNFGAEYIHGIRTSKYTLHLILFVDFQRFSRFTYNKNETFCLFSLLLLTYWISIQKPYFFSRFWFYMFCFRSFVPYNIILQPYIMLHFDICKGLFAFNHNLTLSYLLIYVNSV